MKEGEKESGKR